MQRREFLLSGAAALCLAAIPGFNARAQETLFPVRMSDAAWRRRLSPEAYAVLRQEATERPFSSALDKEERSGLYACAGCSNPLYSSDAKYDSRTGWPSFWAPVSEDAIGTKTDHKLLFARTEVHCSQCGGHLGHIFDDGPEPTGKRHCINGVALSFVPAEGVSG